jgi:hypothetical protein
MFCKSAKISVMGFFELVMVLIDYNLTRKALFHVPNFGEGIGQYEHIITDNEHENSVKYFL